MTAHASPLPSRADLRRAGRAARATMPLDAHREWQPAPDRPDPVALLEEQSATRRQDLVPIRYGRMSLTSFTYLRGAAMPMASDLATTPNAGILVQLCGDAHLSNFGLFASPERDLVFDLSDFDESLRGPFEWDVKRLAASIVVAGRSRHFDRHVLRRAVHRTVASYRTRMAAYALMPAIAVYYSRVDAAGILAYVDRRARPFLRQAVQSAHRHDAMHVLPKLTAVDAEGNRRIVDRPPVITHLPDVTTTASLAAVVAGYRETLEEDRRILFDRYELEDVALKVVGVGSVGLLAFAALFLGGDDDDPLFLQVKQAEPSVLERFLAPSDQPSPGARVIAGQRRLQAASDILLGWAVGELGRHWYVRQLQDQKGGAVVEAMTLEDLVTWGELCGWALARGHARSGQPAEIAGYLGATSAFEHAIAAFALAYADQNERDFAAFRAAIKSGRITARKGV